MTGDRGSGPPILPPDPRTHAEASPDLARLLRWLGAGGTCAVIRRTPDSVTLSLRRCDGGEEADRMSSVEPDVHRYLDEIDGGVEWADSGGMPAH